jgi:hypothetical protein
MLITLKKSPLSCHAELWPREKNGALGEGTVGVFDEEVEERNRLAARMGIRRIAFDADRGWGEFAAGGGNKQERVQGGEIGGNCEIGISNEWKVGLE